jgi:thioredoxin reductase (NADPH)
MSCKRQQSHWIDFPRAYGILNLYLGAEGGAMERNDFDVVIAGGGPAGLTAALYAGRSKLRTLLLEKMAPGGQIANTFSMENYPGFPEGISGADFSAAMEKQARKFGVEICMGEVRKLIPEGKIWAIRTEEGEWKSRAVIVATGLEAKKLGVPGEAEMVGRGVSYCATCDGPFFQDAEIAVVGGGDSAVHEALYLTRFASRVTLIHRRNALRAEKILQERAFQNEKIEIFWDTVVTRVLGDSGVEEVELKNLKTLETQRVKVRGVFFYIGLIPHTAFLEGVVELDEEGYVLTDANMATSAPGIFAAGDVRQKCVRQVATAVGDGAMAAVAAERYIECCP